jgi:glycosyltransferase involved in cell wall biosynthesis
MSDGNPFVSIIISSHNYAEYVGAAIESALGIDWPAVEIIVVDDGSTDGSQAVIERYADRVTVIHQQQSTERVANNVGFASSRGDVIIFLDSDDILHPTVIRELAAVWRPGISKVQFQMIRIDAGGNPMGSIFPQYDVVPTPERIRDWLAKSDAYPTPPGSGNAYSRWFLEKIFPLDGSCGDYSDSACLAAAPYYGDIVTIKKPLVSYRVHGRNVSAFSTLDAKRFSREVQRAQLRFAFSQRIAKSVGITIPDDNLTKSIHFLQHRIASIKLAPALHPIVGDTLTMAMFDGIRGAMVYRGATLKTRIAILLWALAVAVSPERLAKHLVLWKFASATQPIYLRKALAGFGIAQGL